MTNNLISFLIFALILAGCTASTTEITDNSPAKPETSSQHQVASPEPGSTPIQATSTDSNVSEIDFSNLSRQDVILIQHQLNELGYSPGKADGIMGKNTRMALMNFQHDYNLLETGKPNLETTRLLENKINGLSSPVNDQLSSHSKSLGVSEVKEEILLAKTDNNQSSSRILVPGGLNKYNLNKLWKTAKNKCVDLHYSVATETRLTGNIVCVNKTKAGENMMIVNFDNTGFLVTMRGTTENISKANMESVLKTAAGMSK
jgi:peptidoglycan hydrolase-like protein with peptidoglycan-binding domain